MKSGVAVVSDHQIFHQGFVDAAASVPRRAAPR